MPGTDPRTAKTRHAISEAFHQLLKTREFSDISVNDVTAAAGISRPTFYRHYRDKFDWLEQSISESLIGYIAGYRNVDLLDRDSLIRNMTELFFNIGNDSRLCRLITASKNHELMYSLFRENLMEQFRERHGPSARLSPEEDLAVHHIAASSSAFIEWWVRNTSLFTPDQLARCIYSFHHQSNE